MTQSKRYLLHTTTDKPIYKLKDTVYIRAVHLNAIDQKPISKKLSMYYSTTCNIIGPKGDTIKSSKLEVCTDSTFAVQWEIPEDAAGGNYFVKFESEVENFISSERKFEIRAFQNPRLNTQLDFVKKGYTAGESVTATLNVKRAEGGVPNEGTIVSCSARIDGKEAWSGDVKLDKTGNCLIKFDLPTFIEIGEGTLIGIIKDGGVVETASKTIPILREYIDCNVYPEGGDLVHNLECGIYVEAFTPQGEPADFSADIIDSDNKVVGSIDTKHEGRGKGFLTPDKSKSYHLQVKRPIGIKKPIPLPKVKDFGVSMISLNDTYNGKNDLSFKVSASKSGEYKAIVYKKDVELQSLNFKIEKDESSSVIQFSLPNDSQSDGVLRVLIKGNIPLAERLVFRQPSDKINLEIVPNYKSYSPGDSCQVTVKAKNQKGEPITCYTSVTVVDESVLESVEKRKQAPRLPCMVFLEQEVAHLEDANIYLSDDPKSELAIDLLLGTQGWRRFAFQDPSKFISKNKEKFERVLGIHEGISMENVRDRNRVFDEDDFECELECDEEDCNFAFEDESTIEEPKEMVMEEMKKEERKMEAPKPPKLAPKQMVKEDKKQVNLAPKKKMEVKMEKQMDEMAFAPRLEILGDMEEEKDEIDFRFIDRFERIPVESFVRVFAFKKTPNRKAGDRTNFAETLYWSAVVKTDKNGEAKFNFDLSDSVTSFRIITDSFSRKALFGSNSKLIESKEPFYLEPKVPLEVTSKDRILLPVGICNSSSEELKAAISVNIDSKVVTLENSKVLNEKVNLGSNDRKRLVLDLAVHDGNQSVSLEIKGSAGVFADKVTRPLKVVPLGFPMSIASSGLLENSVSFDFSIPKDVIGSSIVSNLEFVLTPAGTLNKALEALIREPCGCFEQTSSSNYPLTMAYQYFTETKGTDPAIIKRSYDLLDRGYKRLISYECKENGYEWFGSGPGHEALTSYGILQFLEMSKFYPVDKNMLERTIKWLEGRKDKKGGFLRNTLALDDFGGAPEDITNAYIIYCLSESSIVNIKDEIDHIYKEASSKKDTYLLGLASGALYNVGQKEKAIELFKKLADFQDQDGSVKNSTTTITRSGGKSLIIETTAIAVLNWLNEKEFAMNVEKAMKWLLSNSKYGGYGNTQATILSIKAILKYEKRNAGKGKDGYITLKINNKSYKKSISEGTEVIKFDELAQVINKPGDYSIELSATKDLSVPYLLSVDYCSVQPETSENAKIKLRTKLTDVKLKEGSGSEIQVEVENIEDKKQAMTMAIIGLPGGLEPRHDQLKELVSSNTIGQYEIRGRDVIIYLRGMKEKQILKFKIDVIARIPGTYTGPASRSYLYYTNEDKYWVEGLQVLITPEDEVSQVIEDLKKYPIVKPKKGLFGSSTNDDFDVKL